jgi:hypothetical protein
MTPTTKRNILVFLLTGNIVSFFVFLQHDDFASACFAAVISVWCFDVLGVAQRELEEKGDQE